MVEKPAALDQHSKCNQTVEMMWVQQHNNTREPTNGRHNARSSKDGRPARDCLRLLLNLSTSQRHCER